MIDYEDSEYALYKKQYDKVTTTQVIFIKELDLHINNEDVPDDDRDIALSLYECLSCHWQFYGDVVKYGGCFDYEGKQTPDYCPMCGRKITEESEVSDGRIKEN
jgi:rubrerythrin